MATTMLTVRTNKGTTCDLPTKWRGTNAALHRPVCNGGPGTIGWTITHIESGFAAALLFDVPMHRCMRLAKLWDGAIGEIDATDASKWRAKKQWGDDIRRVEAGKDPLGPDHKSTPLERLEAATSLEEINAAMRDCFLGDSSPDDGDGSEPFPTELPTTPNADGWPCIQWRGKAWEVPSMADIEEWTFDSVCETPTGSTVEPDHPESWLSLLGII